MTRANAARVLRVGFACAALCCFERVQSACAGPPYVTDDPEPTPYRHWEMYFGLNDADERALLTGSAFAEFDYGALPNVQVSASIPCGDDTDTGFEFGIKTRFIQESSRMPQVSFYPSMTFAPLGHRGHAQTFLPFWAQKSSGPWTAFGGGGVDLNSGPQQHDFTFVGGALERELSRGTTIGAEWYHESASTATEAARTAAGVGSTFQTGAEHAVLFSFGHSLSGAARINVYGSYEIHT